MKNTTKNPVSSAGRLGKNNSNRMDDITLPIQRQRLLKWLQENPITTLQARSLLNILAPAARIFELRHDENYNIITHWIEDVTAEGKKHRVAKYVLLQGSWRGN